MKRSPNAGLGIVLLLIPLLFVLGCGSDTKRASTATTAPSSLETAFVQGEGEIFLEAAGNSGPESFTGETFVPAGPTPTLNIPTTNTVSSASTSATQTGTIVVSYAGDTPALYGGSKSKTIADKEGQLSFFEQNADKAAAFCAALSSDGTFAWSGSDQIQPDQLRDYFSELTPLMLIHDTRITNHGYRDGKPTPRQSVLQAGQLVLVDRYGVPRVRCECGNPLIPPKPVQKTPKYTGTPWPGFDPSTIIVVEHSAVMIDTFVVIDIATGDSFGRPAGTSGDQDTDTTPTSTTTTTTAEPSKLFDNHNSMAVKGGGTAPTFELAAPTQITSLETYHYIDGGVPAAGTISLQGDDGKTYGPFQATGTAGQGGISNAYWTITPADLVLPPGRYTIIDSDPGTFSQNGKNGGVGMFRLWGVVVR